MSLMEVADNQLVSPKVVQHLSRHIAQLHVENANLNAAVDTLSTANAHLISEIGELKARLATLDDVKEPGNPNQN